MDLNIEKLQKEFVLYKESLDLKELGFNETCIACYMFETKPNFKWELNFNICNNKYIHIVASPSYSQAFKWFREKYNLDSHCRQIDTDKFYWKVSKINTSDKIKGYSNFAKNIEEAEFECLKKLIEIVTDKK